jgi:low affinity Fe/Cu permease
VVHQTTHALESTFHNHRYNEEDTLRPDRHRLHHKASHAISNTTTLLGSVTAICLAATVVGIWAVGLLFVKGGVFNARYDMLITSLTTVITFVMVFIIQSTQHRESRALQTKVDALLIAKQGLDEGELLGLEDKPDSTIKDVQSEIHEGERLESESASRLLISADFSGAAAPKRAT